MSIEDDLRRMGFDPDQIATATENGKPLAEAVKPKKQSDGWPGFKSKWEARYAAELDAQLRGGEITQWVYEDVGFRLTAPTVVNGKKIRAITYTPDFVCWLPDGRLRAIEIKGYRRTKDINRYKLAKDKFRNVEWIMLSLADGNWVQIM